MFETKRHQLIFPAVTIPSASHEDTVRMTQKGLLAKFNSHVKEQQALKQKIEQV